MDALLAAITALPEAKERFAKALGGGGGEIFDLAGRHGLRGVLLHHAREVGLAPEGTDAWLAAERAVQKRQRAALDEATAALSAADVRAVALKGPLLGARVYPAPGRRPSTDLDLMIREAELERAVRALATAGWLPSDDRKAASFYREHHHHVHLARAGAPMVELHHRALSSFGVLVPSEELVARARPYGGAWVLTPEDEWLYLAVHAASHVFERLGWLYDLKLLARAEQIDWRIVVERAHALRLLSVVSFARELLVEIGATIPADGFRRPRPGARLLYGASRESRAARMALRLMLCDGPGAAARLLEHKVRGRLV
jgi:hypothetical protein